jgi:hypothetical protein
VARDTVQILINLIKKGAGAKEAAKELDIAEKAAKRFQQALAGLATVQTVKAVYELGKLGAQSLRTERSFEAISGSASEAEKRLDAMRRATRGAISEQAMMSAASRMMQMGLANNSEELEKMAGMAVRLGGAMGKDAAGAIEEWNLMIANQSIPRLDTFGVSASRVRVKMKALQAATADMTREEAFMIAVMEEGEASLVRLGEATDDEMLAFERLEASTENLKAAFAQRLAPAVAVVAGALAEQATAVLEHKTTFDEYERSLWRAALTQEEIGAASQLSAGQMRDYVEMAGMAIPVAEDLADAQDGLAEIQERVAESAGRVAKSFGELEFDNESIWEMARATGASLDSLSVLADNLGIASNEEIQASLNIAKLNEMLGAGMISAEDYAKNVMMIGEGLGEITQLTVSAETAQADLEMRMKPLGGAMEDVDTAGGDLKTTTDDTTTAFYDAKYGAEDLTEGLYGTHDAFDETVERASRLREALANLKAMAKETRQALDDLGETTGRSETMQAGGIAGGGAVMVGEGGPELTLLPRGSRVIPAWETRQVLRSMTDNRQYHRGGDTFILQDPLAVAMALEERRRAINRSLRVNM